MPSDGQQRQIRSRDRQDPPGVDIETRLWSQFRRCPKPDAYGPCTIYDMTGRAPIRRDQVAAAARLILSSAGHHDLSHAGSHRMIRH